MLYFKKTPGWLYRVFPQALWKMDEANKKIYLTFDDGPIPQLTPWVLSTLDEYDAKATFFYVGDNIRKHPALFEKALKADHSIGNHTYNHLRGWKTPSAVYLDNIEKCEAQIQAVSGGQSRRLFRPPYGQLTFSLARSIAGSYRIVMWDYLTGDFDPSLSPEKCHHGAIRKVGAGSIVIYHENVKANASIRFSLPLFLEHFSQLGYQFCAIE